MLCPFEVMFYLFTDKMNHLCEQNLAYTCTVIIANVPSQFEVF